MPCGGGLVAQSCLTLETPRTVACQAPLSMGFSRHECWSGLPFPSPGDLPDPGIEPGSPALQAYSLLTELWGNCFRQSKIPPPSFPLEAWYLGTCPWRGWTLVTCFNVGFWRALPLELSGKLAEAVADASQFLLWVILCSSLPHRHYYEEMILLSDQGLFPKEWDLRLKISLNLSQMSDEKEKFLVGLQDYLKDLSGNCLLFYIYNLN